MRVGSEVLMLALLVASVGCTEDRVVQPAGDSDAHLAAQEPDADTTLPDGGGGSCDMTGRWIGVQVVYASALGAQQKTVNWFFHEITQTGDSFTIVQSLNCGLRVTGTTTVTISDVTTEALAKKTSFSNGRKGTFKPTADGKCEFTLDRTYNLRGAALGPFLLDTWMVGDPPLPLTDFMPLPANAAEGMEDWDGDGKEGITLHTGLGDRYVAQRDWSQDHGFVAPGDRIGGKGLIVVTWDGQEKVSTQTPLILQTGSTPVNPGYAYYERVGDRLEVVTTGAHPELETCKNVQRIALEDFADP
jgi:hypothetical protein